MNKLRTYLVGSIQDAKDGGTKWRDDLTKHFVDFGFEVQDPCKAECNHSLADNIEDQKKKLENLKRGGAWEQYDECMMKIIQSDLVCVNNSAFLTVLYDPTKRIGGTVHEIVEAWQKGIKIYTVSYQPITEFNDWILTLLRNNFKNGGKIFKNFKQLMEHIEIEYKDYIKDFQTLKKGELKK